MLFLLFVLVPISLLGAIATWFLYRHVHKPVRWGAARRPVTVRPGEAHLALAKRWGSDPALAPMEDSEARVAELECYYGVSLPEDFRIYLLNTAPTAYFMDEDGNAWWSVYNIRNIREEWDRDHPGYSIDPVSQGKADRYLIFADCLVWCYAWAICCSDGENRGKVIIDDDTDWVVADSFTQFVELELNNSPAIHPGPETAAVQ